MPNNINTADAVVNTPSIKITGNPDIWRLVCKAAAPTWMKSTKALEADGGIVLQVTTEFRASPDAVPHACSDALIYIPGATLKGLGVK